MPLHRSPFRRSVFNIPNSNLPYSATKSTACPKRACSGTFLVAHCFLKENILNGVACHCYGVLSEAVSSSLKLPPKSTARPKTVVQWHKNQFRIFVRMYSRATAPTVDISRLPMIP